MTVRLNTHLENLAPSEPNTPKSTPSGVNPSLGQVAPAIPLDAANSRARHGHHHVHDHNFNINVSVPDATGDSSDSSDTSDESTDCDENGGEDGDCEAEENQIHIS